MKEIIEKKAEKVYVYERQPPPRWGNCEVSRGISCYMRNERKLLHKQSLRRQRR